MCGGVGVEVIEGGELAGGGLDGVAGLVEQGVDLAGVAADVLVADAGQGRDGFAGQPVAVAEDGGGEPVGQGEAGAAAEAVAAAGAVAAVAVQPGFAELGGGDGQGGGQGVQGRRVRPVMAGWASQARSGRAARGWAGAGAAAGAGCRV